MTARTYRVIVRGFFDGLDDDRRAAPLAELAEHDLLGARRVRAGVTSSDDVTVRRR